MHFFYISSAREYFYGSANIVNLHNALKELSHINNYRQLENNLANVLRISGLLNAGIILRKDLLVYPI